MASEAVAKEQRARIRIVIADDHRNDWRALLDEVKGEG